MLCLLIADATFLPPMSTTVMVKRKMKSRRLFSILKNQQDRERVGNKSYLAWYSMFLQSASFRERVQQGRKKKMTTAATRGRGSIKTV